MEQPSLLERKLELTVKEMNRVKNAKGPDSIDGILRMKIRDELEGKCSEHGYVKVGTVEILSRSAGYYEPGRFTGNCIFDTKAKATVFYPVDGAEVIGKVLMKNKLGLFVGMGDVLRIIIPRDLHIGDLSYEEVQPQDKIRFVLKKTKFQINDPHILGTGQFLRKVDKGERERVVAEEATDGVRETKDAT